MITVGYRFVYNSLSANRTNMLSQPQALANYRTVGLSLVASRRYLCGEEVLMDTPMIEWDAANADLGPKVEELLITYSVPRFLAAAACALWPTVLAGIQADPHQLDAETSSSRYQALCKMHTPTLPICLSYIQLTQFAQEFVKHFVRELGTSFSSLVSGLLHAMMAAKVNAHRGPSGLWSMLPIGSKLAHSCDPNLYYISRGAQGTFEGNIFSFIAVRDISAGELLTFSYVGGPMLLMSAKSRQQRLQSSHLFVCVCNRCRGPDKVRTYRCPQCNHSTLVRRTSPMLQGPFDAYPSGQALWSCQQGDCNYSSYRDPSDEDSISSLLLGQSCISNDALEAEDRLEKELATYLPSPEKSLPGASASSSPTAEKSLSYLALIPLLSQAEHLLGVAHHVTRESMQLIANYFKLMCQQGQALRAKAIGPYVAWQIRCLCLSERAHSIRCWPKYIGSENDEQCATARQAAYPHMTVTRQFLILCEQILPCLQHLLIAAFAAAKTSDDGRQADAHSCSADEGVLIALVAGILKSALPMALSTSGGSECADSSAENKKLKSFVAMSNLLNTIGASSERLGGGYALTTHYWVHYGLEHSSRYDTLAAFIVNVCGGVGASEIAEPTDGARLCLVLPRVLTLDAADDARPTGESTMSSATVLLKSLWSLV